MDAAPRATDVSASSITHVSAISLFVEDLAASKAFYATVLDAPVAFEDATSVALKLDNLIVNLLQVDSAHELVGEGNVGGRDAGARFQLSIWVPDVDDVCARLATLGVTMTGPHDKPWGMRAATFVDPAGNSWEVAQRLA
ncbi:MAG: Glyoxalase/bleomycin resistance protein/dioxygenase [Gemmatimonadetes bacterium]|nr:Glyoxalase/bleomycin resistance protein/dioxygenase [Gemmatimonadota bacterium]